MLWTVQRMLCIFHPRIPWVQRKWIAIMQGRIIHGRDIIKTAPKWKHVKRTLKDAIVKSNLKVMLIIITIDISMYRRGRIFLNENNTKDITLLTGENIRRKAMPNTIMFKTTCDTRGQPWLSKVTRDRRLTVMELDLFLQLTHIIQQQHIPWKIVLIKRGLATVKLANKWFLLQEALSPLEQVALVTVIWVPVKTTYIKMLGWQQQRTRLCNGTLLWKAIHHFFLHMSTKIT